MEGKYVMKFRSKADYLVFSWMIAVCCLVGFASVSGEGKLEWRVILYFLVGAYTTLVIFLWVNRNKKIWKETLNNCPSCGSENTVKAGFYYGKNEKKQKYVCKDCGRGFRR